MLDSGAQNAIAAVTKGLEKQAARYRQKYNKKVVLVLDGVDILAKNKEGEAVYDQLIEWAKAQADTGDICVVFVSSEGAGVRFLERTQ